MQPKATGALDVVDCCVFHDWPSTVALAPYLSDGWREVFLEPNRKGGPARVRANPMYVDPLGAKRPSAHPETGRRDLTSSCSSSSCSSGAAAAGSCSATTTRC
jgi:hypothetical protein